MVLPSQLLSVWFAWSISPLILFSCFHILAHQIFGLSGSFLISASWHLAEEPSALKENWSLFLVRCSCSSSPVALVISLLGLYARTKSPQWAVCWSSSDTVHRCNDSRLRACLPGAAVCVKASDIRFNGSIFTSISGKPLFIFFLWWRRDVPLTWRVLHFKGVIQNGWWGFYWALNGFGEWLIYDSLNKNIAQTVQVF